MKVKALFTGFDLTEEKIYEVIYEYDTVYELRCDTGIYCRNKEFFEIVQKDEYCSNCECFNEFIDEDGRALYGDCMKHNKRVKHENCCDGWEEIVNHLYCIDEDELPY